MEGESVAGVAGSGGGHGRDLGAAAGLSNVKTFTRSPSQPLCLHLSPPRPASVRGVWRRRLHHPLSPPFSIHATFSLSPVEAQPPHLSLPPPPRESRRFSSRSFPSPVLTNERGWNFRSNGGGRWWSWRRNYLLSFFLFGNKYSWRRKGRVVMRCVGKKVTEYFFFSSPFLVLVKA